MNITPIVATQFLSCFRCVSIGIPEDTIAPGEQCMEISHADKIQFSCMDCFDRLLEELESVPDSGDESVA